MSSPPSTSAEGSSSVLAVPHEKTALGRSSAAADKKRHNRRFSFHVLKRSRTRAKNAKHDKSSSSKHSRDASPSRSITRSRSPNVRDRSPSRSRSYFSRRAHHSGSVEREPSRGALFPAAGGGSGGATSPKPRSRTETSVPSSELYSAPSSSQAEVYPNAFEESTTTTSSSATQQQQPPPSPRKSPSSVGNIMSRLKKSAQAHAPHLRHRDSDSRNSSRSEREAAKTTPTSPSLKPVLNRADTSPLGDLGGDKYSLATSSTSTSSNAKGERSTSSSSRSRRVSDTSSPRTRATSPSTGKSSRSRNGGGSVGRSSGKHVRHSTEPPSLSSSNKESVSSPNGKPSRDEGAGGTSSSSSSSDHRRFDFKRSEHNEKTRGRLLAKKRRSHSHTRPPVTVLAETRGRDAAVTGDSLVNMADILGMGVNGVEELLAEEERKEAAAAKAAATGTSGSGGSGKAGSADSGDEVDSNAYDFSTKLLHKFEETQLQVDAGLYSLKRIRAFYLRVQKLEQQYCKELQTVVQQEMDKMYAYKVQDRTGAGHFALQMLYKFASVVTEREKYAASLETNTCDPLEEVYRMGLEHHKVAVERESDGERELATEKVKLEHLKKRALKAIESDPTDMPQGKSGWAFKLKSRKKNVLEATKEYKDQLDSVKFLQKTQMGVVSPANLKELQDIELMRMESMRQNVMNACLAQEECLSTMQDLNRIIHDAARDIVPEDNVTTFVKDIVERSGPPHQIEDLPYELPRTVFEIEEEHNRRDLLAHADLSRLFGTTLEQVARLPENKDHVIPKLISHMTMEIERLGGFETVGIFRMSANQSELELLQAMVCSNKYDIPDGTLPHNPAALLKLFFRELKNPLLPVSIYNKAVALGRSLMETQSVRGKEKELLAVLDDLPELNRTIFEFFAKFLVKVAAHSKVNKMTFDNIAIVFAPTLMMAPNNNDQMIRLSNTQFEIKFLSSILEVIGLRNSGADFDDRPPPQSPTLVHARASLTAASSATAMSTTLHSRALTESSTLTDMSLGSTILEHGSGDAAEVGSTGSGSGRPKSMSTASDQSGRWSRARSPKRQNSTSSTRSSDAAASPKPTSPFSKISVNGKAVDLRKRSTNGSKGGGGDEAADANMQKRSSKEAMLDYMRHGSDKSLSSADRK